MPFITCQSDTSASADNGDAMLAYTKRSSDIADDDNMVYTNMPGVYHSQHSAEHNENNMEETNNPDVDSFFLGKFDFYVYTTIRLD